MTGLTKDQARLAETTIIAAYTIPRMDNNIYSIAMRRLRDGEFNQEIKDIWYNLSEAVYDMLEALNIEYIRTDHKAALTMEDCIAADKLLGVELCKNLFLCNRQKTDFYLLLIPAGKEFRTKDLSHQINTARLSFASEDVMKELLGLTPGSVSVMGLMNDTAHKVRLIIDKDLLSSEFFGCHPCINTSSLRIRTSDLMEKILPHLGCKPTFVDL